MIPNSFHKIFAFALDDCNGPRDQLIRKYKDQGMSEVDAKEAAKTEIKNYSPEQREKFFEETAKAVDTAKKRSANELKTIYKINNRSTTALRQNMLGYTFEGKMPELHLTKREQKDRKALSQVARGKYIDIVSNHFANHSYAMTCNDVSAFDRGAQIFFPRPPYNNPERLKQLGKDMELMASRDPNTLEARKEYFENRMKDVIQRIEKVTHARNDAEFLEAMDVETFSDLLAASEMQWKYRDNFMNSFGLGKTVLDPEHPGQTKTNMFVQLDPELMKKWEAMESIFVDTSNYINRLALIAHPDYPRMSPEEASQINNFAKTAFDERLYADIGYITEEESVKFGAYLATRKDRNPKDFLLGAVYTDAFSTTMAPSFLKDSQKILLEYEVKNTLGLNSKDAHFRTIDGEEISLDKAVDNMFAQKTVDVFDKDGKFVQRYERGSTDRYYPGIKETEKYAVIDYVHANPAVLKTTFQNFSKLADAGTHWYMSSSDEYRNFRTALKELNEHDMQDRARTEELMNRVAATAEAYMKLKEKPGTEFSSNTDLRYKAAQMISARMKYAVSELHNTLEAENAAREQEQQIPGGQGGNNNAQGNQLDEQMIIEELAPQKDPMLNPQPGQENIPQKPAKEQIQQQGEMIGEQEEQKAVS